MAENWASIDVPKPEVLSRGVLEIAPASLLNLGITPPLLHGQAPPRFAKLDAGATVGASNLVRPTCSHKMPIRSGLSVILTASAADNDNTTPWRFPAPCAAQGKARFLIGTGCR